jgi:hypothetical protein
MAAVTRAVVRQDRDSRMTNKTNNSLTPVAHQPGRLPARTIRVKLRRVNANLATAYPPDGDSKAWWRRLKKAGGPRCEPRCRALWYETPGSRTRSPERSRRRQGLLA